MAHRWVIRSRYNNLRWTKIVGGDVLVKSVVITLTGTVPDTALNQSGKLVVGTTEYPGTVTAIITHEVQTPTKVTLQAQGLQIASP